VWAIARETWLGAWRQTVLAVEAALLGIEGAVAAVAAVGSPTPAAAAIQVLAVSLSLTPFALLLVAAPYAATPEREPHLWSRPLPPHLHTAGRVLGLWLCGLALAAGLVAETAVALALVAGLPLGGDLAWTALFMGAYVLPGSVFLLGCAWLGAVALGSPGRYVGPAIAFALALAFASYKLDTAIAAIWPSAPLWAPLPGLLTLGLAVPPSLLGAPPLPSWLALERLAYLLAGAALCAWAAVVTGRRLRLHPAASAGAAGALTLASVVAFAALAGVTAGMVPRLAGARAAARFAAAGPDRLAGAAELSLVADAATGRLRGSERLDLVAAAPSRTWLVALNRGLVPRGAAVSGTPVRLAGLAGALPDGATRLWRVTLTAPVRRLHLRLGFGGTLLPAPSVFPYPPYSAGSSPELAAVGQGRAFLYGDGTWWARPAARGGALVPIALSLRLHLDGLARGAQLVSTGRAAAGRPGAATLRWRRAFPADVIVWAAVGAWRGSVDGVVAYLPAPPAAATRRAYGGYAWAMRRLGPWLGGRVATLVSMPLAAPPRYRTGLLAADGDQPFCVPTDPVTGACGGAAPGRAAALWTLAVWGWQGILGPSASTAATAMLAAATAAAVLHLPPDRAAPAWNRRAASLGQSRLYGAAARRLAELVRRMERGGPRALADAAARIAVAARRSGGIRAAVAVALAEGAAA
jgi:hypothetical protein